MVKSLDAPYEAGRRGAGWLKVKPAHTLDLVVLAAEWGHGRRTGKLSNLHLGARDPESGGFVMLGQDVQGHDGRDARLADGASARSARRDREGHVVHVRPELVVEIAFDGVQTSSRYPGGMALRFARVKGYRPDKSPERGGHDRHRAHHPRASGVVSSRQRRRRRFDMTHYGTLRAWAFIATLVGVFGMIAAGIGAIVWAFEVEGFWQTLGVLLIGLPVSIFIATIPIALGQAMRAIADVGDTVAAR